MNYKHLSIILIFVIIIIFSLTLGMIFNLIYSDNDVNDQNVSEHKAAENTKNKDKDYVKQESESIETKNDRESSYSQNDQIVIEEINNIKYKTENDLKSAEQSVKDSCKGVFITFVDFVFYDGEIKGIKFDDLTDAGKEKVLKLISGIDQMIEKYIPNYKESISTHTNEAFNKASEIIGVGAENIKDFSKSKLGEENYNSIINAKDELKTYIKEAGKKFKNASSSIYEKSTDKLKSWYEDFKNSE